MKRVFNRMPNGVIFNLRYEDSDYLCQADEVELPFADNLTDGILQEDPRSRMVVTKVQAMKNLKSAGLLLPVLDYLDAEPRDSDIVILWKSLNFHRLDKTLVWFCKSHLKLTDEQIDSLFL